MAYLAYLLWRTRIDPNAWGRPFRLASVYWHFMGGVWVVLFGVLYFTD
jgi:heme/copper-type cytochrome/quinol oxidase subunit 3